MLFSQSIEHPFKTCFVSLSVDNLSLSFSLSLSLSLSHTLSLTLFLFPMIRVLYFAFWEWPTTLSLLELSPFTFLSFHQFLHFSSNSNLFSPFRFVVVVVRFIDYLDLFFLITTADFVYQISYLLILYFFFFFFYLSSIHYQTHFILDSPACWYFGPICPGGFWGGEGQSQPPRTFWVGLYPNRFGNICQEKNSIFFGSRERAQSQIINVRKGDGTNDNLNTYRKSYKIFLGDEFSLLLLRRIDD